MPLQHSIDELQQLLSYDNLTDFMFRLPRLTKDAAHRVIEVIVTVAIFLYFLAIELRESGLIDRTLQQVRRVQEAKTLKQIQTVESLRDRRLASSWLIAA